MYIGATRFTPDKRWSKHLRDSRKETRCNRPLYQAINSYGESKFHISIVEECSDDCLYEREKYWIEKFDSYANGYNATFGGAGKAVVDYKKVIDTYRICQNESLTAHKLGIDVCTVRSILHDHDVEIVSHGDVLRRKHQRKIIMKNLEGNCMKNFDSSYEATKYISDIYGSQSFESALRHIVDVCRGKRKTAYKYKWCFS